MQISEIGGSPPLGAGARSTAAPFLEQLNAHVAGFAGEADLPPQRAQVNAADEVVPIEYIAAEQGDRIVVRQSPLQTTGHQSIGSLTQVLLTRQKIVGLREEDPRTPIPVDVRGQLSDRKVKMVSWPKPIGPSGNLERLVGVILDDRASGVADDVTIIPGVREG